MTPGRQKCPKIRNKYRQLTKKTKKIQSGHVTFFKIFLYIYVGIFFFLVSYIVEKMSSKARAFTRYENRTRR